MQQVGFVLFDGFHVITFAAMAVFEVANETLDEPRYDISLLSEKGGLVRSSVGALVQTEPFGHGRFDTLIVGGGETFDPTPGMLDFVRKRAFSMGDVRLRTGSMRTPCRNSFPTLRSRRIGSSSKTTEFGLRLE